MTTTTTTTVRDEVYPGYEWVWVAPLDSWVMKWRPRRGVYCPPVLDTSLSWYHVSVPSHLRGGDLKAIPISFRDHHLVYAYYREDVQKWEIWTRHLERSIISLQNYLSTVPTPSPPRKPSSPTPTPCKPKKLMPPLPPDYRPSS